MPTSQYLPFGTGAGANTLSYATYAGLTTLIAQGFQPGIALSEQVNTVLRQTSVSAAALGKFAATYGLLDALDNGDVDDLMAAILSAVDQRIAANQFWHTGMIIGVKRLIVPTGFLYLNNQNVSRTTYAALWDYLGNPNTGDGSTTFTLEDARSDFWRGIDDGRGIVTTGRGIDEEELDMLKAHTHTGFAGQASTNTETGGTGGDNPIVGTTGSTGGFETRPRNRALYWLIKT